VTVITGLPHYPGWRIAAGTRRRLVSEERLNGVRVIRAAHFVPTRQDALRRGAYEATFGLTGLLASTCPDRPDAIVGVVPSLSGGVLARLLAARFKTAYGLLFQDLMGPAAQQSGMAGGGAVARVTTAAERWAVAQAATVGIVSGSFRPYIQSLGIRAELIVDVPNWTRVAPADLSPASTRERFGWTDAEQIVLHAGNIGLKQGLEQVVEAAGAALRGGDPVRFVLSGGGSQAAQIQAAAEGLPNVEFLGLQSERMHANLLSAADVLLLSERPSQIDMSLPSKLTAYYAAGRPIIAAVGVRGASAAEVERSGAGIVVTAGQPDALLDALARLRTEPALGETLGVAGRRYAESSTSATASLARGAAFVDVIATGATGTSHDIGVAA
jgi:glycosyltransferase involved in cell wall biosynthesis